MKTPMKKLIALISLVSTTALAEPISFHMLELRSEKIAGVRKLTIAPADNGKLRVTFDPNKCNDRGVCTKIAVFSEVVEAKVLHNNRPADGPLVLEITPKITLRVGSGFNPDHHIEITALLRDFDGTPLRLTMTPQVTVSVGQ